MKFTELLSKPDYVLTDAEWKDICEKIERGVASRSKIDTKEFDERYERYLKRLYK